MDEEGRKDLVLEGRKVMAGMAKGTTAVEVVAAAEEAVVDKTMVVAANAEMEVGVEVAAMGTGMPVAGVAVETVPRKSVEDEGMGKTVVVAQPVVSMARAAKGKEMPVVAATVA